MPTDDTKRGPGAPRKADKRTPAIKLNQDERDRYDAAAKADGHPNRSTWLRALAEKRIAALEE